ncbi:hypothetical protein LAV_00112 [Sphingobium phage Lacusarx]|uniref:NrS-1 polymerase-like helicase domain-containing protein n=1 Tax=Sphingobium phage Lacusarx TaxID=1980139 RepID=A0A1W6DWU6_9CAUD|nr:hypothetical protein FDH44_gp191 [Sphingobium phage Lacusarx]ARK07487.1 hypothetical protein LAV_00112 [Sphingobium phage Lacusarx]
MATYTKALAELFDGVGGTVVLHDADGATYAETDLAELASIADELIAGDLDPWVDLVTAEGTAIGLFVPGDATAVSPPPSAIVDGGMVYLFNEPVEGQKPGVNLCPLDLIEGAVTYDPTRLELSTDASKRSITLGQGRRSDEKQGKWKEITSTFGAFTDFLRQHNEGQKDGPCFLQGATAGGTRKAAAIIGNDVLGVDLDSGAPLSDVIDTIVRHRLEAVIYTTHSHLKDTSVIKRDHYFKWSGELVATTEGVADYLQQVKGVLPHIVEDVEIVNESHHTEDGIVILVKHRPMPKFRAVFPLKETFVFSKRGGTQQDAIAEWKERYAGFCTELGLFFDEKCVDPARLFYFPRHAKGDTSFGSWHVVGGALDLDDYDRVKMKRGRDGKRRAVSSNAFTAAGGGEEEDDRERYVTDDGFHLRPWAAKFANRFEVEMMLETVVGDDFMRDPRTGGKPGTHVECPFEAEHTSFGGGGTYVVNASDNMDDGFDGGFTFHCVHNACSGRDRLDYLCELINQGVISSKDLQNKEFMVALEGDDDDEDEVEAEADDRRVNAAAAKAGLSGTFAGVRGQSKKPSMEGMTEDEILLWEMNDRYAVIRTSGGVKILVEPRTADGDVSFESQNDVALFEKNNVLWMGDGKKGKQKIEVFKLWLEWEHRRTYVDVVFEPGRETEEHTYNLFRGWPYSPKETFWEQVTDNKDKPVPGDWSMLRGHIYENICESNDEMFGWLMTWLAHLFQHPDQKPGSTVVVTGKKGTGKSTLFDYVNKALGRCGITVSQRKQIVGQFNGHLATTLLMVCEEAFWAADPQAEGVLKDMITNKSMLIEKKGYDPIQSNNYTRLALISNNEWVVPASLKDERRFFVLRCSDARQGDLAFFGALREQMEKLGGIEAMMYDLMTWEPTNGHFSSLYTPPVTQYLQQQQVESLSGVQKFMLELVKSGIYETHDDKVEAIELNTDKETMVTAVDMRAAIEDYTRFRFASDKAKTSYDDISSVVIDWFGAREVKMQLEGSTNRKRMFIFPPLAETRATLKEKKGLDIEAMTEETVKNLKSR